MALNYIGGLPYLSTVSPYDESIYYASGLDSGSDITLPNSETYGDDAAKDILVIFNDRIAEAARDFSVPVGTSKTYITLIYDLPADSVVRFIKK